MTWAFCHALHERVQLRNSPPLLELSPAEVHMVPVVSLIGFREYAASRRFLHQVRDEILNSPAADAVDLYPSAKSEQDEGFAGARAVIEALSRPAALAVVSGHCWADQSRGGKRTMWWIGGRTGGRAESDWYFYLNDLAGRDSTGRIGATGGLILDCCEGGNPDFFQELVPHLNPDVPCLGVDGEAAPRGTRHLNLTVIRRLFGTSIPNLDAAHVADIMNGVADGVRQRRRKNFPRVHRAPSGAHAN